MTKPKLNPGSGKEAIRADISRAFKRSLPRSAEPSARRTIGFRIDGADRRCHVLYDHACIRCGRSDVELGRRELHHGACAGGLDDGVG